METKSPGLVGITNLVADRVVYISGVTMSTMIPIVFYPTFYFTDAAFKLS